MRRIPGGAFMLLVSSGMAILAIIFEITDLYFLSVLAALWAILFAIWEEK